MDEPKNEQPEEEKRRAAESLRAWGFDVDVFEARAKESVGGAKDDLKGVMGMLRETLSQARDRVASAAKTTSPATSELKTAFEKAWKDLEEGFTRAGEKMREARRERQSSPKPPDDEPPQLPEA